MKIEKKIGEFELEYNSSEVLKNAFSTINNALFVTNNSKSVVVLDEDTNLLYEMDYIINENSIEFSNARSIIIKDTRHDEAKSAFVKALSEDTDELDAIKLARISAKKLTESKINNYKSDIIIKARTVNSKQKNSGRENIVESLRYFKVLNRDRIEDLKESFYNEFVEKYNNKYLSEGKTISITNRFNFNLVPHKIKFVKKLKNEFVFENVNSIDSYEIASSSITLQDKMKKFALKSSKVILSEGVDLGVQKAAEAFVTFAKNWPILFTINEEKHIDLAMRVFARELSGVEAKDAFKVYKAVLSSDEFANARKEYLSEQTDTPVNVKPSYNVKIIDSVLNAVNYIAENMINERSLNILNYIKHSKEKLDTMLKSGTYNEELFERIVIDIFGDGKLLSENFSEAVEDITDSDIGFGQTYKVETLSDEDVRKYSLETRAVHLAMKLKEAVNYADKNTARLIIEEVEVVDSMIAVDSIDENRLNAVEKFYLSLNVDGDKKVSINESSEDSGSIYCTNCFETINNRIVNEALSNGRETIVCGSCGSKLRVK